MATVLPVNLPPREAVEYFRRKGFTISFDWQEVYAEEHARAFTVAKVMQLDILADIRDAVDRVIAEGTTFEQFKRELTPLLQEKGWWGKKRMTDPATGKEREVQLGSPRRLRTIYDTNLRTAHAAGKWEQIQRTRARRPYLRYVAILDDRTRPQHRRWHGVVLPADHPFWQQHYPPNGWKCRCGVQQLSDRDLQRYGYRVSDPAPSTPTTQWVNPRTGEVRHVPVGIDPGFDYNPGAAGLAHARQLLAARLEASTPEIARAAVRQLVDAPEFERFLARPEGSYPVMVVPQVARDAIGAKGQIARLSGESLGKNLKHHPELQAEDYRRVPGAGERPHLIVQDGLRTVVIVTKAEGLLWTVVKATVDGAEMYVTSVRYANRAGVAALKRRAGAKVLLEEGADGAE